MENINQLTQQLVDNESLEGISQLAEQQLAYEQQIAELQVKMDDAAEKLSRIRDILLPEAMTSVGMSSFKLKDGTSVEINPFYSAKIPEEKHREAFAWLRTNNFGEIIKREIKCAFGKGDDERATEVAKHLATLKIPFADKESVHPQTLKAFVRERIEKGETLPTELLGVYVGSRAKITPAS